MDFRIEELTARPYLFIRTKTKQSEIGERIGAGLGRLMPYAGTRVAGAPLARWSKWEGDSGEMEVGVPLSEPLDGEGDIEAGELPAGKAAVVTHVGPYDGLASTWNELKRWMGENGLESRADPWEEYIDDCTETPMEQVRTRIVWPC